MGWMTVGPPAVGYDRNRPCAGAWLSEPPALASQVIVVFGLALLRAP
jgi:hypothetical protein